ncbi:glycosyltransferase [Prosthecodimorpha staleyi]|uniref:Glycosyltransferase n=1 Tax=Prosthecodimorpha staleyi TaxID=2840188 RepID=A0A947GBA8_9HYPH|nr:glycosyltransferase [Prosthecodimorpha staleyi]MBT9290058.1 glycosyltransferase [Prosthecodimorpha staleyi]
MPLSVLLVHNNFPGQFGFLAEALRARGDRVAAIAQDGAPGVPGVPIMRWGLKRGTTKGIFEPAVRAEADFLRGRAAARAAEALKAKGFAPDVIVGHPGWGETLFLGEIFPAARRIEYAEFYYRSRGGDVGFDREFAKETLDELCRVHAKNASMLLALAEADAVVAPSRFQVSMLPPRLARDAHVIHEGVDLAAIRPDPAARFALPDGRILDRTTPFVTFVNRRFEPLRGAHVFVRALPAFLAAVPEAEVVLIGAADGKGYGTPPPEGRTWRDIFWAEIADAVDPRRVHFVGTLPHGRMLDAIRAGAAHVYLTYPFVASWSLFEAMAVEALVIGSATAPVQEVVEHGRNGLLVDFFDRAALADTMAAACRRPADFTALRGAARETIAARYDRARIGVRPWLDLIDAVAGEGPRP